MFDRSNIRLNQNTAIAIYFNSTNHNLSRLTVIQIELIFNDENIQRRNKEYYWQVRLGIIYPKGLHNYLAEDNNSAINTLLYTTTDLENLNNLQALRNENQD